MFFLPGGSGGGGEGGGGGDVMIQKNRDELFHTVRDSDLPSLQQQSSTLIQVQSIMKCDCISSTMFCVRR